MTETKNLKGLSEELGKISSESEIVMLLTNAIKYISDKLLDAEEKMSREDELKIEIFLEKLKSLKNVFQKYAEFFSKNKEQIKTLLQFQDTIEILQEKVFFSSQILRITDYFPKLQKDLLQVLAYTNTFFTLNNFSGVEKNSFQSLLNVIEKGKTKQEKVITLRNELGNIEGFITRIEKRFQKFEDLVKDVNEEIQKMSDYIQYLFSESIKTIFGKMATGNVAFQFEDNFFLTLLLEDIFHRIPRNNSGVKNFLEDLTEIGKSKNYAMVKEKNIITGDDYEKFLEIFQVYGNLYELHFGLQTQIAELKSDLTHFNAGGVLLIPPDAGDDSKKLKVFSRGKQNFLHDIRDFQLNATHLFDDIKIEKKSIGNSQLLKIKKEIFSKMFSLLEMILISRPQASDFENIRIDDIEAIASKKINADFTQNEKLIKGVLEIMKLSTKFSQEKKQIYASGDSHEEEGKKSTFHYKPVLGEYGVIEKFEEVKTDEIVAKTIGKTADEIREMVENILSRDQFSHILESFPGNSGSLEGNYIILGPWGGGKTALIKEMSQNPNIATVEVGKADIANMWVGTTEKNIKAMYELSAQIHRQTKKHVFIFIDEVDALLAPISTTKGVMNIQKEIQTMLDGVHAYPGVHTIMLSNKPHGIPIDIYRRMEKTFVLADLDLKEKVELVHSRIDRYPMSEDLQLFLTSLGDYYPNMNFLLNTGFEQEHIESYLETYDFTQAKEVSLKDSKVLLNLYLEKSLKITDKKAKENIERMYLVTPKILWQVTERVFKNYIGRFSNKDLLKLEKQLSKLKDKTNGKRVHKIFAQFEPQITLEYFFEAMDQVFSNASTQSEITGNIKFYKNVDQMMKMISSSAFDGVEDEQRPSRVFNIQIID